MEDVKLLIDVTIVIVALPDMVDDLDASFGALQWVIDAYALALGALVLGAGSIADRVGHSRAYVVGLALFAVSSLLCGLAPNSGVLIAARAVQGVGAAAMFATTFALLNSTYVGRDRGSAYGIWGAVSGASAAVGPILGGLLTEGASWRWIFLVNLPVSAVAILLCGRTLTVAHTRVRGRIDVAGMASFTAAAACATYALIRANEDGWSAAAVWWLLVVAALLLAAFVAIEARTRHAMFDLALLRNRSFVAVLLAGLLLTFAAFTTLTYTSIWLQSVLGLSPLAAGLTGLPMSVTAFAVSAVLGRLLHGRRPDLVIGVGLLFVGLGSLLTAALVHGSASWPALLPGLALIGVGVGLATPILGSVSMSLVPAERGGMAAGAVNTTRQLGFAFGVAALGSVFTAQAQIILTGRGIADPASVAHAIAGGQTPGLLRSTPAAGRQLLDSAAHAAGVAGVQATFAVAGAVGVLASLLVIVLMRPGRPRAAASIERPPVAEAAGR
ncbi:drug resistance transporter, EmrB/QacA subfamily [Micromonospora coriariae]|uniref:Drug resistance transporter, EmrB/QacA subfamily n=1 Tax=Micromonospora coriariae TaxID=285665 RepID=A0A1C4XCM7_9ACTN|nr:MFS transporter [Micromonospora coriariae]SCF06074.1 drug resistance transporter, EmrB/QacA subfamily [Micromonospora coriariae]